MSQPLSDIRVLDFGIVTAGGATTQLLADFGADVIKIEPPSQPDLFRRWASVTGSVGGDGDLDCPPFRTVSRNKRGIAINIKDPRGLEIALRLAAISDLVVENYRRGVMKRLGMGFDQLTSVREDIVLLSIGSQGETGPECGYASFGSSLDALGGIMSVTGYDAGTPTWSSNKINYPDQVVSLLAPALALNAVDFARRTGVGQFIDLSQRELVTSLLGEFVLSRSLTGSDPVPTGNAAYGIPEWCSPCTGDDEWIAISVRDDHELDRLAECVGYRVQSWNGSLARRTEDPALAEAVKQWSQQRGKAEAMGALQAAGVAAVAVMRGAELLDDPYLTAISFFREVDLPRGGTERQRGWPVHSDDEDYARISSRGPHVGEHTEEVLAELLGYTGAEVARLAEAGVVGLYQPDEQDS
jgi:crotonobetainyl-CoA:carnitine CoA-transferase CaiB-like acyl-CoA transferase